MTFEQMLERKKEKGYSCRMISELSGVPLSTVQKIFSGITKSPRYETLDAIEAVLYDQVTTLRAKQAGYVIEDGHSPMRVEEVAPDYGTGIGPYTVDDYFALPDDRRCELIDGYFYDMATPTITHQLLVGELYIQFRQCVQDACGCMVVLSPFGVQLDLDDKTMVEPDLIVFCKTDVLINKCFRGAPELVCEVLSPSTRRKDLTLKMRKYREAGVKEYWIIDPKNRQVMVHDFTDFTFPTIYSFNEDIPVALSKGEFRITLAGLLPTLDLIE